MKNIPKKINYFEIKHFDNNKAQLSPKKKELISQGGTKFKHELIDPHINNFYEFYVDGIMLIKYIWKESRHLEFLTNYNGLLGVHSKLDDELLIQTLKKEKLNQKTLTKYYEKYNLQLNENRIDPILKNYNNPTILIYGCRICGDRSCGGIYTKIYKHQNYITWKIDTEIEFNANLEQYYKELDRFLKNWRKA